MAKEQVNKIALFEMLTFRVLETVHSPYTNEMQAVLSLLITSNFN
jgi:hypothetical protein